MPEVGQVYVDKDPRAAFRALHVVAVIKRCENAVHKDYAVAIARGKVIVVSVNRLLDKTRFQKSEPLAVPA